MTSCTLDNHTDIQGQDAHENLLSQHKSSKKLKILNSIINLASNQRSMVNNVPSGQNIHNTH